MTTTDTLSAAQGLRAQAAAGLPVAKSPGFLLAVARQMEAAERFMADADALNDKVNDLRLSLLGWRLIAAAQTALIIALAAML